MTIEEPTTKNDLGVDCISRAEMLKYQEYLHGKMPNEENYKLWKFIKNLPSVTPQFSSELEKNSKKLEKNFGELDCISRADAIKAMQDKAKKLTNEDTINGLCGAVAILFDLPSVTPQPRKGHWKLVQRGKVIDVCCSNCEAVRIKGYAYNYTIDELSKEDINECFGSAEMRYCPNCGADMREVEE